MNNRIGFAVLTRWLTLFKEKMPDDSASSERDIDRLFTERNEHEDFARANEVSASFSEQWIHGLPRKPILIGIILAIVTVFLYRGVAHHEFLTFDDSPYVTRNIHVNTGLSLENIAWALKSLDEANWHPLTWISHMVDCQLFGLNPGPHHLVNVALHTMNVLLLFALLATATGAVWRSTFAAALFAVHPLNVESVAWVAQRKSLLCAFFCLLTILAYGVYVRRPCWQRYLVVVVMFLCALMAKPMAVTLPLVLLLFDYWPLERNGNSPPRRKWLNLAIEKVPLLVMSVLSSWVTIVAQRTGGAVAALSGLPLTLRIANAFVSYATYFWKTFWPVPLAVWYPHPEQSLGWGHVLVSVLILVLITLSVCYFSRIPYLITGWFFFLVVFVPVIGVVQVGHQAMADRYAYLPCIGLFLILSWGLEAIARSAAMPRLATGTLALGMIVAYASVTAHYLPNWQNGVSLFTHARQVLGQTDPTLEESLADALLAEGRYEEAFVHYRETSSCNRNMPFVITIWRRSFIIGANFVTRSISIRSPQASLRTGVSSFPV